MYNFHKSNLFLLDFTCIKLISYLVNNYNIKLTYKKCT